MRNSECRFAIESTNCKAFFWLANSSQEKNEHVLMIGLLFLHNISNCYSHFSLVWSVWNPFLIKDKIISVKILFFMTSSIVLNHHQDAIVRWIEVQTINSVAILIDDCVGIKLVLWSEVALFFYPSLLYWSNWIVFQQLWRFRYLFLVEICCARLLGGYWGHISTAIIVIQDVDFV